MTNVEYSVALTRALNMNPYARYDFRADGVYCIDGPESHGFTWRKCERLTIVNAEQYVVQNEHGWVSAYNPHYHYWAVTRRP